MSESVRVTQRRPYAEVFKRADGKWDFRLRAGNGEIIATSGGQGYDERNDAVEGWIRVFDACDYHVPEIRFA